MTIKYRDELGYVIETVDEYGVSFVGTIAYFNDKQIDIKYIDCIVQETIDEISQ
jgi:hypothetical protein